jgi:hypothetical protein
VDAGFPLTLRETTRLNAVCQYVKGRTRYAIDYVSIQYLLTILRYEIVTGMLTDGRARGTVCGIE